MPESPARSVSITPEMFGRWAGPDNGYVCPVCSAVVRSREQHIGWHESLGQQIKECDPMPDPSRIDYEEGWARGYRRGFDAALRQLSSEVYARLTAPLNVPMLVDARADFEQHARSKDTHA